MPDENRLTPRKTPSQRRSRKTFDAILDAAARVFSERGFAAGTTNHIAAEAGVSIGSLYQYFPNKNAILIALLERHLADAEKSYEEILVRAAEGGLSPREVIRELLGLMISESLIDPRLHKVLLEASLRSPAILDQGGEIVEEMAGKVEEILRASPGVRVRDPKLASRLATLAGFLLTHWYVLYGAASASRPDFVDGVADLLVRYLFHDGRGGAV